MKRRWLIAPIESALQKQLADALHISPMLARVLMNRGQRTPEAAERYLHPRLSDFSDPFLLPDIKVAIARVFAAIERGEAKSARVWQFPLTYWLNRQPGRADLMVSQKAARQRRSDKICDILTLSP